MMIIMMLRVFFRVKRPTVLSRWNLTFPWICAFKKTRVWINNVCSTTITHKHTMHWLFLNLWAKIIKIRIQSSEFKWNYCLTFPVQSIQTTTLKNVFCYQWSNQMKAVEKFIIIRIARVDDNVDRKRDVAFYVLNHDFRYTFAQFTSIVLA